MAPGVPSVPKPAVSVFHQVSLKGDLGPAVGIGFFDGERQFDRGTLGDGNQGDDFRRLACDSLLMDAATSGLPCGLTWPGRRSSGR